MARIYAGILGPLAMLTCATRSLLHGGGAADLTTACGALALFAAAGYVIGWLAERTVEEAVVRRLLVEMSARPSDRRTPETARAGQNR